MFWIDIIHITQNWIPVIIKIKSTKRTNNTLQNTTHKAKNWSNIWQLPSNMTWKLLHAWVICAACLRHMCCMLESYVLHVQHICLKHAAHMTQACSTYDSSMQHICLKHAAHMTQACSTYASSMQHIWLKKGANRDSAMIFLFNI
jgi:hypothetical protein